MFQPLRRLSQLRCSVARFRRQEDGALTIFGLLLLIMMMVAGGFALDIMRSEVDRTNLQNAVDRAVLAAAALEQDRDPRTVVEDFLRASQVDVDDVQIVVSDTGSVRSVSAATTSEIDSLFLGMLGHETVLQPVSSEAREEETELELSLVVDISGSMGGTKITNLRSAATDFVTELLRDREDLTTISIVPYNDRVNLGSLLPNYFEMTDEHDLSNCVVFDNTDFSSTGLTAGTVLQRMGHFDWVSGGATNAQGNISSPLCREDDYGAVLAWSNNVTELTTHIAGLGAGWNTAMDLGVKVGTMLLDPTSRDELGEMIADTHVDAVFAGRPFDYGTEGVQKVLVVMTDGVNTSQWDLRESRKNGPSGVFVHNTAVTAPGNPNAGNNGNGVGDFDGNNGLANGLIDQLVPSLLNGVSNYTNAWTNLRDNVPLNDHTGWWASDEREFFTAWDGTENANTFFSVWSDDQNAFWVPHLGIYQSTPFGATDAVELTYPELFSQMSINYLDDTLLGSADTNTRNHYNGAWQTTQWHSSANANLAAICGAARAADIIIYTIAFNAPTSGQTAMQGCAGVGNEANFINVTDLDIEAAFDDILASINRLRLTQ
ncbi:TadE/TadG family type IV pilus assembly protein [Jannaschia sp. M317]|uniref:TadE/TadG family type IV pilus assembly protein n=1 Tax=Jannaschia sp. M317 TaxID=2867011 RepID=UPI0021A567D7|nr:TadE/TadG family type IV pilus assembly protein [Jannaschia sp. M317]UWQ17496.1 hypothetical protein K3551_16715 [Jannaschia sp. M317]